MIQRFKESNYTKMKHCMADKFIQEDMESIAGKWNLTKEDACFLLKFVGRKYRLDKQSGRLYCDCLDHRSEKCQEADYNAAMTIYDILTHEPYPCSGEYASLASFNQVQVSAAPAGGGLFGKTAREFDHQEDRLSRACSALGGEPRLPGDVSFRIPVFRDLCMVLQFWSSDEEFGPQLQLLCDTNVLHLMHYETMMFLAGHVLDRISEEMRTISYEFHEQ